MMIDENFDFIEKVYNKLRSAKVSKVEQSRESYDYGGLF